MNCSRELVANNTELFAGHNWKQPGALLIILLLLLVIGMWWILDSESKSQLIILNSEYTSVYTTQSLFICVYIILFYYIPRILAHSFSHRPT